MRNICKTIFHTSAFIFSLSLLLGSPALSQTNVEDIETEAQPDPPGINPPPIEAGQDSRDTEAILHEIRREKEEIATLLREINSAGRQVSLAQMFLSGQYFTIFMALIAVAALVAGIIASGMLSGIRSLIRRNVEKLATNEVHSQIENSSHLVVATAHAQHAFSWWEHYHDEFQKCLRGEDYEKSIVRDVRFSCDLSKRGLQELQLSKLDVKNKKMIQALSVGLLNHWVYNRTAECILLEQDGHEIKRDEIDELLNSARECSSYSRREDCGVSWYNLAETSGFCFLKFGDEALQRRGRQQILSTLTDSKRSRNLPAPPNKWVKMAFETYFPTDSEGKPTDIHGIGQIPEIRQES